MMDVFRNQFEFKQMVIPTDNQTGVPRNCGFKEFVVSLIIFNYIQ